MESHGTLSKFQTVFFSTTTHPFWRSTLVLVLLLLLRPFTGHGNPIRTRHPPHKIGQIPVRWPRIQILAPEARVQLRKLRIVEPAHISPRFADRLAGFEVPRRRTHHNQQKHLLVLETLAGAFLGRAHVDRVDYGGVFRRQHVVGRLPGRVGTPAGDGSCGERTTKTRIISPGSHSEKWFRAQNDRNKSTPNFAGRPTRTKSASMKANGCGSEKFQIGFLPLTSWLCSSCLRELMINEKSCMESMQPGDCSVLHICKFQ